MSTQIASHNNRMLSDFGELALPSAADAGVTTLNVSFDIAVKN